MTATKRPLGTTGLRITTVGFGAWAAGGGGWRFSWGPQDDATSIAAIRHAVDLGVNWIDTAAIYGLGHSEEVVGLGACRDPPSPTGHTSSRRAGRSVIRLDPTTRFAATSDRSRSGARLRRRFDGSGIERIDLYQFHWPDEEGTPIEDSWDEMLQLVQEGKIRWPGVCNFPVELLDRAEAVGHVASLQPPFSLIRRDSGADVIPWAAAHQTGVIVYSPMQSGLLTDTFSPARIEAMAAEDWRRASPHFTEPALARNLALRDALRPIAARRGTSVAAVALGWVLAWPGVTAAIVGARSPEQVDGWIGGADVVLTPEELDEIAAAVEATGAGSGPVG